MGGGNVKIKEEFLKTLKKFQQALKRDKAHQIKPKPPVDPANPVPVPKPIVPPRVEK